MKRFSLLSDPFDEYQIGIENQPYLIFSLHGLHYCVDALLVQEIFHLPELTPIAEAPDDIVGILNLHSKILPVMHLALRLGYQPQECRLSDSVIVLEWEGLQIGIIVDLVHEVKNLNPKAIVEEILYGRVKEVKLQFIAGVAKVDTDIIMLLSPEKLLHLENQFRESHRSFKRLSTLSSFYAVWCPNATPEARAIFRERAVHLRQSTDSDFTRLIPLAVIGLNGEYFGLDLEVVREFINIHNVTPIPCCPAHVVGNMNLRGEIVTLVDVRSALNMPLSAASTTSKAIVVHVDDLVAGLPVDEVFDVIYLRPSEVRSIPVAVSGSNEFLRGTAFYSEKMLSILDLPKIFTNGGLMVNEET